LHENGYRRVRTIGAEDAKEIILTKHRGKVTEKDIYEKVLLLVKKMFGVLDRRLLDLCIRG
jgi:hypothetical protein